MRGELRCAWQARSRRAGVIIGCVLTLVIASPGLAGDDCWPKLTENILVGAPEHPSKPLTLELGIEVRDEWLRVVRHQGK
ncbi:MAG TPA: hypothetical protein VHP62_08000, partial [Usitatibacter sp.]|nr:hypothetical protein [Usitatibacter sp.]